LGRPDSRTRHRRSASVEPDAEQDSSPRRPSDRSRAGSSFDLTFALREDRDAAEAHADFVVLAEAQEAGAHGPISAAPTARLRLHELSTDGSRHVRKPK